MKNLQSGQLLVELILVIGLVALILPALMTAFSASREGKAQQEQRLQAAALLKETEVAVKAIKNNNWTAITSATVNTDYYPSVSGSSWVLTSGVETVNGFSRSLRIYNVTRNASGAIAASGTVDPSTKQIVITIAWTQPRSSTITSTLYFTRTDNITSTETTLTQFNAGTRTSSVALATNPSSVADDGQVQLGAGGGSQSDWCTPNLTINPHDLPKSGVANAITAIEGRVFAGTGDNASGVSFANVSITNAHPPVASTLGTADGYKTNAVFGEANYAYLATDTNSRHVVILDLNQVSNGKYVDVGYFDANTSSNASGLFVSGNIGYMTAGSTLYTFNLTSKTGSRSQLASRALSGTINKIYVVGNFVYAATSASNAELQIIEVSNNGATLTARGSLNVDGQAGQDVYVNPSGTRAYLATGASSTQRELFIINTTTKTSPTLVSTYEANGMSPKGVTVVTNNKAVLVGIGGEEYQVINVATETAPARCGGVQIDTGVNGISSVLEADGDAYSYIITGDSASELKIIEGGAGAAFATSGTFESATFDPAAFDGGTYPRTFNRFIATVSQPSQTTLRLQMGITALNGLGTCTGVTFTYLGPDGTSNTYFSPSGNTLSAAVPSNLVGTYQNPGRCARYKVWLDTSDSTQTPVLYDYTWNYTP